MRNRAKCKLCEKTIESMHPSDYQLCLCGEIAIDGGESNFKCYAKNWDNFFRVDDDGREIPITVVESPISSDKTAAQEMPPPTKEDMLKMLDEMIKSLESLPDHALRQPVSQYDHMSMMILIRELFKAV